MAEAGGKGLQGQLHLLVCITTGIWLLSSSSYPLCNVAGAGPGGWTYMSPLTRQLGGHCPPSSAPEQIPPKALCKYNCWCDYSLHLNFMAPVSEMA